MKKFFKYAMAIMAAALISPLFIACSSSDDDEVKNYDLTITFQRSNELQDAKIVDGKLTISNGTATETQNVTDLTKAITVNKPQGSYNITFSAKVDGEATAIVSGSAKAELYSNQTVTVALQKGRQSSLVFKTIHSTGSAQFYVGDSYLEIVNNSDEVQYLDQLILAAPMGNLKAASAWQTELPGMYNSGIYAVIAFPGNGTDYPLQPGKFVVVADRALNHQLAYGEDESKKDDYAGCPNLENADWEIYLNNGAAVDNEQVPNMDIVYNAAMPSLKMWGLCLAGRAYMLIKLPAGITPEEYVANEDNLKLTPGSTDGKPYVVFPSEYVLDAVEVFPIGTEPEENVPFFLAKDDQKGIQGNANYGGKCVRRKVAKIENGRAYYKDSNNSSVDFKREQDITPGVEPTTADE